MTPVGELACKFFGCRCGSPCSTLKNKNRFIKKLWKTTKTIKKKCPDSSLSEKRKSVFVCEKEREVVCAFLGEGERERDGETER